MAREAKMLDAAGSLLLKKIVHDAVLRIQIIIDIHLTDIMEQIKIKVIRPHLFQLLFEYFLYLRHIGKIITGELISKIIAFPRIF